MAGWMGHPPAGAYLRTRVGVLCSLLGHLLSGPLLAGRIKLPMLSRAALRASSQGSQGSHRQLQAGVRVAIRVCVALNNPHHPSVALRAKMHKSTKRAGRSDTHTAHVCCWLCPYEGALAHTCARAHARMLGSCTTRARTELAKWKASATRSFMWPAQPCASPPAAPASPLPCSSCACAGCGWALCRRVRRWQHHDAWARIPPSLGGRPATYVCVHLTHAHIHTCVHTCGSKQGRIIYPEVLSQPC